jgi:3-hydroxyacyl-CoA dehydrogenase / enoyl-CoA hydratase / 3-hydroxybutyryl-CoA epimerase / enoyl-CoA isomerase
MEDILRSVDLDYLYSEQVACINFAFNSRNTLSFENVQLLSSVLDEVLNNPVTRCIIFNSTAPGYFSDGFSLKQIFGKQARAQLKDGETPLYDGVARTYQYLIECPIPTISFVDGICRGGGLEWGLSSDFIVATPNSKFALHEVRIGIVPGLGGVEMMKNKCNSSTINFYLLSGDYLSTSQAVKAGLVDAKVDDFQEMLDRFVLPISRHPRKSLIRSKSFINSQETKIAALHSSRTPFLNFLKHAAHVKSA